MSKHTCRECRLRNETGCPLGYTCEPCSRPACTPMCLLHEAKREKDAWIARTKRAEDYIERLLLVSRDTARWFEALAKLVPPGQEAHPENHCATDKEHKAYCAADKACRGPTGPTENVSIQAQLDTAIKERDTAIRERDEYRCSKLGYKREFLGMEADRDVAIGKRDAAIKERDEARLRYDEISAESKKIREAYALVIKERDEYQQRMELADQEHLKLLNKSDKVEIDQNYKF